MNTQNTQLEVSKANEQALSVFSNSNSFEQAQRFANALCKSDIVPQAYRNNIPNTLVALEMANRMGESPLMVMQNLDIIHGKPAFNGKFTISRVNTCGQFSPLRFKYTGEGDSKTCFAYAKDTATGETLEGPPVSIGMAKKEGWYTRSGSKWQSMPELMLMYRAGTFFQRMYAPELTMGMQTTEELHDIGLTEAAQPVSAPIAELNTQVSEQTAKPKATRSRRPTPEIQDAELVQANEAPKIVEQPKADEQANTQPTEEDLM
jgi:hypothetical protein